MASPTVLDFPATLVGESSVLVALRSIAIELVEAVPPRELFRLSDDAMLDATAAIEQLGRYVDALRIEAAAELESRSLDLSHPSGGLAKRKGCRNAVELLERVTLIAGTSAARRIKLGTQTRPDGRFPARFPVVASALDAGMLGVDAASAIVSSILPALRRCGFDGIRPAEEELVSAAIGRSELVSAASTADEVRQQAMVWQAYLDPDGMEPVERRAWNGRGFDAGHLSGGLVRGRYALMPEVAAKLTRVFDAHLSPRSSIEFRTAEEKAAEQAEADAAADSRNRDQQRHDVIAAMVDHYSRSEEPPTIGGAAPTVLVTVRADDLDRNSGRGNIDGAKAPVSMRTIRHLACSGGYQIVTVDASGSIHGLGSPQRCFTAAQRKAIIARDGGCLIPGCTIPAAWCEIHHVDPAENGGPTHTDNGVLLCWSHHRTIETSGWKIRMIRGAPHLKAPPWLSPPSQLGPSPWRPATKSPTAMLTIVEARVARC